MEVASALEKSIGALSIVKVSRTVGVVYSVSHVSDAVASKEREMNCMTQELNRLRLFGGNQSFGSHPLPEELVRSFEFYTEL